MKGGGGGGEFGVTVHLHVDAYFPEDSLSAYGTCMKQNILSKDFKEPTNLLKRVG